MLQPRQPPLQRRCVSWVVDDNCDGADSLAEILALMGNDTRTAYDGQQAVSMASVFRPDVVLLDIG